MSDERRTFPVVLVQMDRGLQWIERICAIIAGIAALAAMFLVTCDAVMRHLFSAPLTFQTTLTQNYVLVALLLMAMPWGYRTGGFIRLDMLFRVLPALVGQIVLRLGLAASALYIAQLALLSFLHFQKVFLRGDVVMGVIDWPVAPSWVWLPIGLGLLSLRLMLDAVSPHRYNTGTADA